MNNITLTWVQTDDDGIIKIYCNDIKNNIIINSKIKEIEGIKNFFREIIYKSFFNNEKIKINLENPPIEELDEAYNIINEVVVTCNIALKNVYEDDTQYDFDDLDL